jgi:hypothetical protein
MPLALQASLSLLESRSVAMTDPSDSDIIASKPIGEGLDGFRHLFRLTCESLGISELQDALTRVGHIVEATGMTVLRHLMAKF